MFTGPILLFLFFLSIFFRLFDFDPFRNSGRVKVYAEFESLRVGKTTTLIYGIILKEINIKKIKFISHLKKKPIEHNQLLLFPDIKTKN